MFDGQIQEPLHILLFFAAGVASLPLAWLAWRATPLSAAPRLAWLGLGALLLCWGVLAPLHVLNMATGQHMLWLDGAEGDDTGLVEFSTFGGFVLSAVVCAVMAARSKALDRGFYVLAMLAAVYVAGEEISWGQWIFHWASPELFVADNLQKETNTHNFLPPMFFDEAYTIGGWVFISAVAGLILFGRRLAAWFRPLRVVRESPVSVVMILSAGILMQHAFFQELSELVLALAGLHSFVWLATRPKTDAAQAAQPTSARPPEQRLAA